MKLSWSLGVQTDPRAGDRVGGWALPHLLLDPLKNFKEEGGNLNTGAKRKNEALKTSGNSGLCGISFLTCKARFHQSIISEIDDPQSLKANVSQTWVGSISFGIRND